MWVGLYQVVSSLIAVVSNAEISNPPFGVSDVFDRSHTIVSSCDLHTTIQGGLTLYVCVALSHGQPCHGTLNCIHRSMDIRIYLVRCIYHWTVVGGGPQAVYGVILCDLHLWDMYAFGNGIILITCRLSFLLSLRSS